MTSTRTSLYDSVSQVYSRFAAAVLLVLLSPLMAVLAVLVRRSLGAPVLFRQERPGLGGHPFTIIKFRTMREPLPLEARVSSDGARLTPLGERLRASSLDELPSLWNVLRGDMNLVGPRPLLLEYLERYSPQQGRRHEIRPGLTGLAQVSGRNALSWERKLALDVEYVDRRSLSTDAWILLRTVLKVVRSEGVSAPGEATAPEFLGADTASQEQGS